ncbi:MAG: TetR/AcrR family transcriptional regulator [Eubacteriaceae bacterium]|nr:TetR/AcrR family transcriptional regulator [Eubacteriaceae bacterium]
MGHYKKGIETKNKILSVAKKLFYEKGFKETTIADIANTADVPVGLVNYYYKKNDLLGDAFHQFILKIYTEIETQVGNHIENQIQRQLIFYRLYYGSIFNNENLLKLYRLYITKDYILEETQEILQNNIYENIMELSLDIDHAVLQRLLVVEYGTRKQLVNDTSSLWDQQAPYQMSDFVSTLSARLTGASLAVIEKNIHKIDSLMKRIRFTADDFINT